MRRVFAAVTVLCLLSSFSAYASGDTFIRIDRDDPEAWRQVLANVRYLEEEHMSGSAQFSAKQFEVFADLLRDHADGDADDGSGDVWIVDCRLETHGLINGIAVSWCGEDNGANLGLSPEEIEAEENGLISLVGQTVTAYTSENDEPVSPTEYVVESWQTEKDLVEGEGFHYLRLYCPDHCWPTAEVIDEFLAFLYENGLAGEYSSDGNAESDGNDESDGSIESVGNIGRDVITGNAGIPSSSGIVGAPGLVGSTGIFRSSVCDDRMEIEGISPDLQYNGRIFESDDGDDSDDSDGSDENNVWLHFHCQAGSGRTGAFMTIYEMVQKPGVPVEVILQHQADTGSGNLVDRAKPDKSPEQKERCVLARAIYLYLQENDGSTWSDWLEEHTRTITMKTGEKLEGDAFSSDPLVVDDSFAAVSEGVATVLAGDLVYYVTVEQ